MRILIRGAGDLASGIGWRLYQSGFQIFMTDLEEPTAVRWKAAFCQAMWNGRCEVEGVAAQRCDNIPETIDALASNAIPILPDPDYKMAELLKPDVVIDASIAKRNTGLKITDAPLVIGVGPGFEAGVDCHAVVETKRGHTLGRCIWSGSALPDTGVPGDVGGYTVERLLRSPCAGTFHAIKEIGDTVYEGEVVAEVDGKAIRSQISGVIRGLLPEGTHVPRAGFKAGDVDPRAKKEYCTMISDKALAIAGGVLEAVCHWLSNREDEDILIR